MTGNRAGGAVTLGELVRTELDHAGWTQAELSRATGYTEKHISRCLNGRDGLSIELAQLWLAEVGRTLVLTTVPLPPTSEG